MSEPPGQSVGSIIDHRLSGCKPPPAALTLVIAEPTVIDNRLSMYDGIRRRQAHEATVVLLGTLDSKRPKAAFLQRRVRAADCHVMRDPVVVVGASGAIRARTRPS